MMEFVKMDVMYMNGFYSLKFNGVMKVFNYNYILLILLLFDILVIMYLVVGFLRLKRILVL